MGGGKEEERWRRRKKRGNIKGEQRGERKWINEAQRPN